MGVTASSLRRKAGGGRVSERTPVADALGLLLGHIASRLRRRGSSADVPWAAVTCRRAWLKLRFERCRTCVGPGTALSYQGCLVSMEMPKSPERVSVRCSGPVLGPSVGRFFARNLWGDHACVFCSSRLCWRCGLRVAAIIVWRCNDPVCSRAFTKLNCIVATVCCVFRVKRMLACNA